MRSEFYRNWLIMPIEQDGGWLCALSAPGCEVFVDDTRHGSAEAAMVAAKTMIDRNTAGLSLIDCLRDLYQEDRLSEQDFYQLLDSLIEQCL